MAEKKSGLLSGFNFNPGPIVPVYMDPLIGLSYKYPQLSSGVLEIIQKEKEESYAWGRKTMKRDLLSKALKKAWKKRKRDQKRRA